MHMCICVYINYILYIICQWICLGESGPGCSAHAEGCDGSTGTQRNIVDVLLVIWIFSFFSIHFV